MSKIKFNQHLKVGFRFRQPRTCIFALALVALTISGSAVAQGRGLVITAEQYDAVTAAGDDGLTLRGTVEQGAPSIIVDIPAPDSEVTTPFQVLLRFEPNDDATINLDTLKIKYGWFDLTEEVLKEMTVTTVGIEGNIETVKPGKYKLKVSIEDSMQRIGKGLLTFNIIK